MVPSGRDPQHPRVVDALVTMNTHCCKTRLYTQCALYALAHPTLTHTDTQIHTYQSRQRHAGHRAHQFDRLTIVDVAVPNCKLLPFRLLIIHCTKAHRKTCFCLPFSYLALIELTVNTDACHQGAERGEAASSRTHMVCGQLRSNPEPEPEPISQTQEHYPAPMDLDYKI